MAGPLLHDSQAVQPLCPLQACGLRSATELHWSRSIVTSPQSDVTSVDACLEGSQSGTSPFRASVAPAHPIGLATPLRQWLSVYCFEHEGSSTESWYLTKLKIANCTRSCVCFVLSAARGVVEVKRWNCLRDGALRGRAHKAQL